MICVLGDLICGEPTGVYIAVMILSFITSFVCVFAALMIGSIGKRK